MTEPCDSLLTADTQRRLKAYAEFERRRGGLLYVMQAVAILLQECLILLITDVPALWAPAVLLPPYAAYFLLRDRVWTHLYRQQGHLDSVVARDDAKQQLRFAAPWGALIGWVVSARKGSRVAFTTTLWTGLIWAPVAFWGRLPVDGFICTSTAVWALNLVLGISTASQRLLLWTRLAYSAGAAAYGLYEHWLFRRINQPAMEPRS